jgi:hypothetical protein
MSARVRPLLLLAGKPSPEARRRLRRLLGRLKSRGVPAEVLRGLRGVEVLEWLGTPGARAVLAKLAKGRAGADLTLEARAALGRAKVKPGG